MFAWLHIRRGELVCACQPRARLVSGGLVRRFRCFPPIVQWGLLLWTLSSRTRSGVQLLTSQLLTTKTWGLWSSKIGFGATSFSGPSPLSGTRLKYNSQNNMIEITWFPKEPTKSTLQWGTLPIRLAKFTLEVSSLRFRDHWINRWFRERVGERLGRLAGNGSRKTRFYPIHQFRILYGKWGIWDGPTVTKLGGSGNMAPGKSWNLSSLNGRKCIRNFANVIFL